MSTIDRLLRHAGESLGPAAVVSGLIPSELAPLLERRNGFYAYDAALHEFPLGSHAPHTDLLRWNSVDLWRSAYGELAAGHFFFGEDLFGGQFSVHHGAFVRFDPETSEVTWMAQDLEGFLAVLEAQARELTGHPIAAAWAARNEPLSPGQRLVPKRPFVLGGEFTVDNLYAAEAVEAMRWRGDLARQIAALPDGTEVRIQLQE